MTLLWRHLALMILALICGVDAYMIDDDCGGFVEKKIDSAFRLISTVITELEKTPVNADVDDLFNTLFGETATSIGNNGARTDHFLPRMKRLAAIQKRIDSDQTSSEADIYDVRFYCTTNRIVKRSDGEYVNKDRNNLAYNPKELKSEFAHCYNIEQPTLMITMTTTGGHSEIQICPWFLRKSRGFKFTDLQDTSQPFYAMLSKLIIPIAAVTRYRPIDALVLMDKVIVHELTHTTQARPATSDMTDNAYGFKNARRLVQAWQADKSLERDPIFNADSNALFAVGTWIIINTGSGIGTDGSFTKPSGNPKAVKPRMRAISTSS
ncbi:hypothetical protein J4E91_005537 [Alternaria rosae]|nr:hypothetical protein J4E91_005537 [Alternaria rosae]